MARDSNYSVCFLGPVFGSTFLSALSFFRYQLLFLFGRYRISNEPKRTPNKRQRGQCRLLLILSTSIDTDPFDFLIAFASTGNQIFPTLAKLRLVVQSGRTHTRHVQSEPVFVSGRQDLFQKRNTQVWLFFDGSL